MRNRALRWLLLGAAAWAATAFSAPARYCDDTGAWLQVLGSGRAAWHDQRAESGYLVWLDGQARLLVNAGSGSALRFGEAGAKFADLDAIVFNTLQASTTTDVPAFLAGSPRTGRDRPLPVFAPPRTDGRAMAFFERLIGLNGLYPRLAGFLPHGSDADASRVPYALEIHEAPTLGGRRWQQGGGKHGGLFRSAHIALSARPVFQGGRPAVAWKVAAGGRSLVFAGAFSDERDDVSAFAKDADALIVDHGITQGTRGDLLARYATPAKLGRIASRAGVRMLILGQRANRTRGFENTSLAAIEAEFSGAVLFANDLTCWGL